MPVPVQTGGGEFRSRQSDMLEPSRSDAIGKGMTLPTSNAP